MFIRAKYVSFKWLRTLAGIALILAAMAAMYLWNKNGREKAAELAAARASEESFEDELGAADEPLLSPKEAMLMGDMSSFIIRDDWIFFKSRLIENGDTVTVYHRPTKERIGSYRVSYIQDAEIEIVCTLDEYCRLVELLYKELQELSGADMPVRYPTEWTRPLMLVLEASNE